MDYDELISQIALGDEKALEKIYLDIKDSVFAVALSILKDYHRSQDVSQDTFIKLCSSANKYIPCGKGRAWILRIAKNSALDILRKKSHIDPTPIDDLYLCTQDSTDKTLANEVLKTALDTLNEKERQIVLLFAVSGYPHKEIAEILGVPYATIRWKYRNALKKLSKVIDIDILI